MGGGAITPQPWPCLRVCRTVCEHRDQGIQRRHIGRQMSNDVQFGLGEQMLDQAQEVVYFGVEVT